MSQTGRTQWATLRGGARLAFEREAGRRALEKEGLEPVADGGELADDQAVVVAQSGAVTSVECTACEARRTLSEAVHHVAFVVERAEHGTRFAELRCVKGHLLATLALSHRR